MGREHAPRVAHQIKRFLDVIEDSNDGTVRLAGTSEQLAVPAGALSRLLRRLHAQSFALRNRVGGQVDDKASGRTEPGFTGGDVGSGGDPGARREQWGFDTGTCERL